MKKYEIRWIILMITLLTMVVSSIITASAKELGIDKNDRLVVFEIFSRDT